MHNWYTQSNPIIALAPMADYTNQPFSLLCREISGGNFTIFREMVSAEAVVRGNQKTLNMCAINDIERPVIIQVFGDQPTVMAQAINIINQLYQPNGFDINMGCPVPKIADRSNAGAALMRKPELAEQIIYSVLETNPSIQLSVKTRLGWNNKEDVYQFIPRLEKAGVKAVTVHGRTKQQGYSGKADWEVIGLLKQMINIPILANGDIKNNEDMENCLSITGADGIMIGRGVLGNPWLLSKKVKPDITSDEFKQVILRHAQLHIDFFGEKSLVTLRKHLPWYFNGMSNNEIKNIKEIRSRLVKVSSISDINEVLLSI